jgi:hypothetical protein
LVGIFQHARLAVNEVRTIQRVSQSVEISLRTLRLRLQQYGFWAALVAVAAYLSLYNETLGDVQRSVGLQPHWTSAGLLVCALILVSGYGAKEGSLPRLIVQS